MDGWDGILELCDGFICLLFLRFRLWWVVVLSNWEDMVGGDVGLGFC